jgi:hypothetical protein
LPFVGGAVLARFWGGLARWWIAILVVFWPSFGGHWVEVWFLNWLRPRLSVAREAQVPARIIVWFVAGAGLAIAMALTAKELAGLRRLPWQAWWLGGLGFIGVELLAHLALRWRGQPSFYNGRG